MPRDFLGLPRVYWVLWGGQFINRLGGFALMFLPLFLTERHRYSEAHAGEVLALFGVGTILGTTVAGWAGDRFGRRPTLLIALPLNAAALLSFLFAPAGAALGAVAFALGVTHGYGPVITAAVTDVVAPADRARAFGYLYWALNLGFSFAAAFGGALSRHGYHWLFIGDAATSLALAAVIASAVPETRPTELDGRRPALDSTLRALADPRFTAFALAQLAMLSVFLQVFMLMPLLERARGVPMRTVGLIAALNGVVIVVTQPLWVRVARAWPAWRGLCLGAVFVALGALGVAHARHATHFALSMFLASLGEVAFSGSGPTYVASIAPPERRASYQGAHSLVWAMASLVAPLVGPRASSWLGADMAWTAGALLCVLAAIAHAVFTRRA